MTEPTGTAKPMRADAAANRERVLEAARATFADVGVGAGVKDIAERAGVGVGTIYRHFANMDDLLHAVVVEAVADFETITAIADEAEDPLDGVYRFISAFLATIDSYGWLFEAILGGQLPQAASEGITPMEGNARLAVVLARAMAKGALRPDLDLLVAAQTLLGVSVSWKYGPMRHSMSLEDATERIMTLFLQGAAPRPA